MSFEKDYPNRKDWRAQYRGSASFDASCRPHGDCPHCLNGRMYRTRKELERLQQEERAYLTQGETNVISD